MGEINVDVPDKIVTPVVETESRLTDRVIGHEGKITQIEEAQKQYVAELQRTIDSLRTELNTATGQTATELRSEIAELRTELQALKDRPVETIEELPEEAGIDLAVPDIETSPKPPENKPKGRKARLKARRKAS